MTLTETRPCAIPSGAAKGDLPFSPGDTVKLTDRFAKALSNKQQKRCKIDWASGRGVVHHCSAYSVSVLWLGRRAQDALPVGAVEKT